MNEKESFYAGHGGTSALEVQIIVSAVMLSYAARMVVKTVLPKCHSFAVEVLADYVMIGIPSLTAIMMPASAPVLALLGLAALAFGFARRPSASSGREAQREMQLSSLASPEFLTAFRSMLMLATSIAILAVDFPLFPRRLAKTEDFGTSLMDTGVGCVVLASGMVTSARGSSPGRSRLRSVLASTLPLLFFGVARFISVKSTGYHEHASEYGVHWNFFLTLAAVAALHGVYLLLTRGAESSSLDLCSGASIAAVHQAALAMGLQDYILNFPRTESFLSLNKEGVISVAGYLSIFLIGSGLGHFCLQPRKHARETMSLARYLLLLSIPLAGLYTLLDSYFLTSRRMCNGSYILWIVTLSLPLLSITALVDALSPRPSVLVSSINYNALALFLLSNLATGAVNLTINTLRVGDFTAYLIVAVYLLLVCGAAGLLYNLKIRMRL